MLLYRATFSQTVLTPPIRDRGAVSALSQEMPPKKHFGSEQFGNERERERGAERDVLNVEQLSER